MKLILYSKPGCHLCEGLHEKLAQVTTLEFDLEIRNIQANPDWLQAYVYEIPVLCVVLPNGQEQALPRLSPRAPVQRLTELLLLRALPLSLN